MIETEEEVKKYFDETRLHLQGLRHLALSAELHRHAGMWLAIEAAFLEGPEEVSTLTDVIHIYVKHRIRAHDERR